MTSPTDPTRPTAPSAREIADLSARLRALTSAGRDVDPAERAAFLADKQALLARITAQTTAQPADQHAGEHRPADVGRSFDDDADGHISTVSWVVGARDAGIDRGEPQRAARFAREAGEAIAAAERFGLTREQLATELDYPGGPDELEMSARDAGVDAENQPDPLPGLDQHTGVFVPDRTADPDRARYETMTPDVAVDRVTAAGFDRADAEFMVDEHLTEQTTRHGTPDGGWAVDPYDLAQIAQRYDWVDREAGETLPVARQRATEQALAWYDRVADLENGAATLPGDVDRALDHAYEWTARAHGVTRGQQDAGDAVDDALDAVDNAREDGAPPEVVEQRAAVARQAIEDAAAVGVAREPGLAVLAHTLNPTWREERDHYDDEDIYYIQPDLDEQRAAEVAGTLRDDRDDDGDDGRDDGEGGVRRGDDPGPPPPEPGGGQVVATFDPADAYTDAEIAAIAAAYTRGDDDEVTRLEDGRPSLVPDLTDTPAEAEAPGAEAPGMETPGPVMPEWMREQARRTEAAVAAGTYVADPDDRARLADRLDDLRTQAEPGRVPAGDPARDAWASERDDAATVAWWAPAGPGEVALTRREAEAALTDRGFTADQAREAVTGYLDEVSHEIGTPVHQWGLDSHDVEAIAHTHHPAVVDEPAEPHTADLPALRVPEQRAAPTPPEAAVEDERREQLIRWHTDDHTDNHGRVDAGRGADAPVRALDDYVPAGTSTSEER